MSTSDIVERVQGYLTRRVCINGGEPLLQYLEPLVRNLRSRDYLIHLETNGSQSFGEAKFNWVAVSPKFIDQVTEEALTLANEVKYVCGAPSWEELINLIWEEYTIVHSRRHWLIPLAEDSQIIQANVELAIEYCKENPRFSVCMQMHKIWNIP